LREPLESRHVSIARAGYRATFPATFQLVAAMNPCPAGQTCAEHACRCSPEQVRRYQARISGPLLDRIDLHVAVPPVPNALMVRAPAAGPDPAADPRSEVARARAVQQQRQGCLNSEIRGAEVLSAARLDRDGRRLLERACDGYGLSARGTHRVLRTARTIADLAGEKAVRVLHLSEALSFRAMDWNGGSGLV